MNRAIPSTIEAAALCKMADRGQIVDGILDGPLALDNAIDPEAAGARVPIILTSRADSVVTRLASCAVAGLVVAWKRRAVARADSGPYSAAYQRGPAMTNTVIGLLLFPNITQLDLTGPFEVFAKMPGADVRLIWKTLEPVRAESGMHILPNTTLADCPALDVIVVPGGPGMNPLMEDEEVLSFLRVQAAGARFVGSVCTGALVLGAAGLLLGKRATSHWSVRDLLARFGAIPTNQRVVRNGKIMTGGGVTAGIDFALTMVEELMGKSVAEGIQLGIEYAPAPPFNAGTPETAPAAVLEAVRARGAALRAVREAIVGRVTGS